MELSFERSLPCTPAQAFTALTIPAAMNRWSTATIELDAPGDGGHPAGVGALRRVLLPDRRTVLREVVVASEAPRRFVYAVVDTPPVRHHRGTIHVEPDAAGCRVRWQVSLTLAARLLEAVARRRLQPELEASLDALARMSPEVEAVEGPPKRVFTGGEEPLFEAAAACGDDQRRRADAAQGLGDPRHWFTRVYQYVTEAQLEACRAGAYEHPHWVLHLIERFHALYLRSLAPRGAAPEAHWARAFRRMAKAHARGANAYRIGGACILYGMRAHIEFDLPRAIAETYATHYRGRCDFVRFRADYLAMGDIFRLASERMIDHFDRRQMPLLDRAASRAPRELRDAVMAWRLYDIPRARRHAFEQAESLVPLLSGSPTNDDRPG